MTHWNHKRHLTGGNPKPRDARDLPDWRMRERLRTVTAALVMCLNIGVDPPDVSKTNPCSKLICWMDPGSLEVSKALPAIGKNLQAQFETLSMKTRYKQYLDPIVEETKRFCTSLRRTAKDERVLFYYNGFGVPKPTPGGEIWVFNKAYTQYIPVTLYDLQNWLGSPCICVWDASAAGNVVVNFKRLAERKAEEEAKQKEGGKDKDGKDKQKEGASSSKPKSSSPSEEPSFPLRESIHLAACAPDEVLPMNPDLPADLFTCCLTSPIEISLRWFVLQNPLPSSLNVDMVMSIPGRLQDRRTPLGELNWIFTAITDTIAWTVLPRIIFRRLFRDDLMVAALLRNFLLAERIMRFYHCTPMSHPKLPPTHNHPLWDSWDLAVDQCLAQLPTLLTKEKAQQEAANGGPPVPMHLASFEYRHSTFFSEQLKAFEVWLSQGGVSRKGRKRKVLKASSLRGVNGVGLNGSGSNSGATSEEEEEDDDESTDPLMARDPPDQLPIVLQVLLSQVHRLRALILLSQFLDLGPWAVNLALSIGIFPYVLKLLQSPAADLKPVLIYIWARILAVDRSCQNDLLRDSGFTYFAGVLSPFHPTTAGASGDGRLPIPNVSEHRAMCAFILSVFCQDFPAGQQACLETDTMDSCLEHLEDDDFLLRQWSALCLAQLWDDKEEAKAKALTKDAHGKLCCMLSDVSPEVRAAILYALGTLLGASGSSYDPNDGISSTLKARPARRCLGTGSTTGMSDAKVRNVEVGIAVAMLATKSDCSPMVRKELVIALSPVVRENLGFFVLAAYLYYHREEVKMRERDGRGAKSCSEETIEADTEALLARVLSKLVLEEDLHEIDIANIPTFTTIFVAILDLSVDAYPEVSSLASTVLDFVVALMIESDVSRASESIMRRFGAIDATNRLVTPTSTRHVPDSYFPPTPRVTTPALEDGMDALGIHQNGHSHQSSNASSVGHGARPHQPPRRSASLAQTVKAIATLGYSRQSSPTGSVSEHEGGSAATPAVGDRSPYLTAAGFSTGGKGKNGAPAPHFNVAHYVSPYTYSGLHSPEGLGSTASAASTPASPTNHSHASLAHRSASAESLAHIASRQRKPPPSISGSTPGATTPTTPGVGSYSHSSSSSSDAPPPKVDEVKVGDALASLIALDLQRFRNRAQIAAEGGLPHGTSSLNTPITSPSMNKLPKESSSNGTSGNAIREVLPLKSRLFSWCSEYYTEPQMKNAEADEAGSVTFNVQTWKRQRNEKLVHDAQNQTEFASKNNWNQNAGLLPVGSSPSLMLFHQFEDQLVTASDQDVVS